jgi:hypothetical protein
MRALCGVKLLILDDWGLEPLGPEQRHDLLEIVEDRYGRGATLITSQLPTDRWHGVIGEPTLADAILDRVVHKRPSHPAQGRVSAQAAHARAGHRLTKPPEMERSHQTSRRSATPADINRNGWPTSIGMPGRLHRNPHLSCEEAAPPWL